MHPLAFDKQGRPFPFHRRTRKLLVRLFRNPAARGTCCQVLDGAGEPLYVEVETDYLEFRKLVGNVPGLYRLDQCDEDGVEIDDALPAYVSIDMSRNAVSLDGGGDVNPLVIIEHLVAIQADVMKTMAAQQAALISASAEILRAPFRPALPPVVVENEHEEKDKDADDECEDCEHAPDRDDTDERDDAPADPWAALRPVMDMIEPHVPKLGAFLYEQFITFLKRSKTEAASPPSASSPAAAPAPTPAPAPAAATSAPNADAQSMGAAAGPSSPPSAAPATPAPAAVSGTRVPPASASTAATEASAVDADDAAISPATSPSVVEPTGPGEQLDNDAQAHASAIDVGASTAAPRTAASSAAAKASATTQRTVTPSIPTPTATPLAVEASGAAPPPRNALPEPTPEQVRHLLEIRERLSAKERAIAENAISRMSPDVLSDWLSELSAMSVDQATDVLRQMIARIRAPRAGG